MDALSDLLRVLRFSGGVFLEATFRAPWCIDSQVDETDCAPGTATTENLIGFHYVLDGSLQLQVKGSDTLHCAAGELIVLARNDRHRIGSDLALPPMPAEELIHKAGDHELAMIDVGQGEAVQCRLVCGYLASAVRAHPLLDALPTALVSSMRRRPSADWVESSFRFAAQAHAAREAGAQEMLARLSELLFVEAIRDHINSLPPESTGWLAALRDPPLARALGALHHQLARPWTTESLTQEALLSRSAFAERFARTLGMPPMTYLTVGACWSPRRNCVIRRCRSAGLPPRWAMNRSRPSRARLHARWACRPERFVVRAARSVGAAAQPEVHRGHLP